MAYERGQASVEVELSRVQSWLEFTDPQLWGRNGDKGVIQEHHDYIIERKATMRFVRSAVGLMAALGGIPALIVILQLFHVIPK